VLPLTPSVEITQNQLLRVCRTCLSSVGEQLEGREMPELAAFTLADGSTVLVEALATPQVSIDVESGGSDHVAVRGWRDRVSAASEVTTVAANRTFEQAVEGVQPAATSLVKQLRAMADSPDEVSVEFGLQMSAQAGAYIAQAAATANFKITLVWRRAAEPYR
jgi:hypothetical protein